MVARGVVVGLGSHVSWDRKLDGRLAGMLMSIPAVKAVEIGLGFEAARRPGSAVHDPIDPARRRAAGQARRCPARRRPPRRLPPAAPTTPAGSRAASPPASRSSLRVAMKPISTLMSPLPTVDLATGRPANAQSERSDVTAVPAMGVIAEALMALVLADAMLEKFGGDSLAEMRRNFDGYVASLGRALVGAPGSGRGLRCGATSCWWASPGSGRAPSARWWPRRCRPR